MLANSTPWKLVLISWRLASDKYARLSGSQYGMRANERKSCLSVPWNTLTTLSMAQVKLMEALVHSPPVSDAEDGDDLSVVQAAPLPARAALPARSRATAAVARAGRAAIKLREIKGACNDKLAQMQSRLRLRVSHTRGRKKRVNKTAFLAQHRRSSFLNCKLLAFTLFPFVSQHITHAPSNCCASSLDTPIVADGVEVLWTDRRGNQVEPSLCFSPFACGKICDRLWLLQAREVESAWLRSARIYAKVWQKFHHASIGNCVWPEYSR